MIAYHNYYYRTNYYAFIHKMNNLTAYQLHYYVLPDLTLSYLARVKFPVHILVFS